MAGNLENGGENNENGGVLVNYLALEQDVDDIERQVGNVERDHDQIERVVCLFAGSIRPDSFSTTASVSTSDLSGLKERTRRDQTVFVMAVVGWRIVDCDRQRRLMVVVGLTVAL